MKNLTYLIILCTFFSCTTPDKLSVYIKAELKKNNGTIDLTKFNDVKWDKLYVISPYASDDSFDRFLNDYKDEIKGTGVTINEMKTVLALFEGDKMVSMSELYNNVANFQQGRKLNGGQIGYYTPQNAVFKYKIINGYNTVVGGASYSSFFGVSFLLSCFSNKFVKGRPLLNKNRALSLWPICLDFKYTDT